MRSSSASIVPYRLVFVFLIIDTALLNVNVNKQYLSTRKFCNKGYDGCAMRVVFSKPQNCLGFNDGDFRDGGSAIQHMGPETAKAREPNVTVLVRGKSRSPWVAARR